MSRWRTISVGFAACVALCSACSGTSGTGSSGVVENSGATMPAEGDDKAASNASGSSSSSTSGSGSSTPLTPEQCIAQCEAKHPTGAAKGAAIDTCWAASCPSCQNLPSNGKLYDPQSGRCQTPVHTLSAQCSQCTVSKCCAAWDGCFGDKECLALNACANACYQ